MSSYRKRKYSTEKSARSKEEALALALIELETSEDEVIIEVLDEGSKGFLGIGARDARVKVTLKNAPEETEEDTNEGGIEIVDYEDEVSSAPYEPKKREPKRSKPTRESLGTPDMDAKKFLEDIFAAMGLNVTVTATFENDAVSVLLEGDNMGIVIGKRGDTLDSLQYLTSLVVNQRSSDYIKVSIDTENYREKRTDALLALSNRLADKVTRTGKKYTLEPMNPYERRIIHSNLQSNPEVTTFSVGQEPYRKVVIAPKNTKPYKKDNFKKRSSRPRKQDKKPMPKLEQTDDVSEELTYKADFKPQQHKAEYKNFEEYLEAHSGDDTI